MKYFFSLLLYRLLLLALSPVIIIFFLLLSLKKPAFGQRLIERLGIVPKGLKANGIVVHAASVGEVIALKAFIEKLLISQPNLPITLTTFTPTGSAQVTKLFGSRVQHCYLPLDIFPCTQLFLNRLRPKAVVFMETEIWPNMIRQISQRNIKLLLINARLSDKSVRSYLKLTWLITPSLAQFDQILPQSHSNLANFITIGAPADLCQTLGNVKFDISHNASIEDKKQELSSLLPAKRDIWLVASTHKGDEELALAAFKTLINQHPQLLLVIVPRHPERFNLVTKLCQQHQFNVLNRSENTPVTDSTQVWVLDSLGELMASYALSSIVTMGGSFSEVNGHNPLEPALYKKPIIVGPHMKNFTEITQQLTEVDGLVHLTSTAPTELAQAVATLLTHKAQQHHLGENAYQVVLNNQGASDKSLAVLQALLSPPDAITTLTQGNSYCQFNTALFNNDIHLNNDDKHLPNCPDFRSGFTPEMLSPHYWQQVNAVTGSAQGRGTTWFVAYNQHQWVLRHYYRGGFIGKFNNDHYIFTSYANTRAAKEYNLLNKMQAWQLPAPKPVAYRVIRKGLFYQADLLSSRIENAQDLVALLIKQPLSQEIWHKIGTTIKQFHEKGIYHHDLNAHNILFDDNEQPWLIDFDRGEQRQVNEAWQQSNMERLLRSFRKEKNQLTSFHWQEADWLFLLAGYQERKN